MSFNEEPFTPQNESPEFDPVASFLSSRPDRFAPLPPPADPQSDPMTAIEDNVDDEQEALYAGHMAQLIKFGLAPVLPESLPPRWRIPYEAVRNIAVSRLYERQQTFLQYIYHSPYKTHMLMAVEDAIESADNPCHDSLRVYSGWEVLDQPPDQEWCVQGLFARPSVNLLVGDPGSKKTWLALDLAVSVATGQPWLGHATSQSLPLASVGEGESPNPVIPETNSQVSPPQATTGPTPVLIVDEEGGLQRTWDRLGRTLRGHSAPQQTPVYFIPPAGYNLARQSEADALADRALSLNAGLIIVDALVNVTPGTDENNVMSMQPFIANLKRLARRANAAVVVVHHTNKQGVFRGSSLIASGVDHMLLVQSESDSTDIELTTIKARDIPPAFIKAQAHFAQLQDGKPAFHLSLASAGFRLPSPTSTAGLLMRYIGSEPIGFQRLTRSHPHLSMGTIRNILQQLMTAGFLERSDGGGRGKPALYVLTGQAIAAMRAVKAPPTPTPDSND